MKEIIENKKSGGGGRLAIMLTVDEVVRVPTSNPTVSLFSPLRSNSPCNSIIAQVAGDAPSAG